MSFPTTAKNIDTLSTNASSINRRKKSKFVNYPIVEASVELIYPRGR